MNDDNTAVTITNSATIFTGDAVEMVRVVHIKHAIGLWQKYKMLTTRGATISKMLQLAHDVTKKGPYKNSDAGYSAALVDLDIWLNTLKAAMPVIDTRREVPGGICENCGEPNMAHMGGSCYGM
jgi:hypothetical protein